MSATAMAVAVTVETFAIWTASLLGGALLEGGMFLRERLIMRASPPYQSTQTLTIVFPIGPGKASQGVVTAPFEPAPRLERWRFPAVVCAPCQSDEVLDLVCCLA